MANASDVMDGARYEVPQVKPRLQRLLDSVECVGNKVPHPAVIFVTLAVLVVQSTAGAIGNDQALIDRLEAASERTDEELVAGIPRAHMSFSPPARARR